MTQKTKNVALEKILEQTTLKPCDFWAGEALEARTRDCLNITSAQKWHSAISQISAEKSFRVGVSFNLLNAKEDMFWK